MIEATAYVPQLAEAPRAKPEVLSLRSAGRAAAPARSEAVSAEAASSTSRLAYDRELSRVFVEIVDPESGEVVDRFPPEELVKHMNSMIEQDFSSSSPDGAGLLIDRVV